MKTKIKILVIAPYQGLAELVKNLAGEFEEFELTIQQGDLSKSIDLLERYKISSFDFIISRGGTADMIRQYTSVPVIDIEVSGYDILRILTLLKGYQSSIEVIGFRNVIQSFEAISSLIDADIYLTEINHESEVESALLNAKKRDVQVVVGDTVTVRMANEIGIQGVLITSGRESVVEAFLKAKQMNQELQRLNERTIIYEYLFDRLEEGIAIIDDSGNLHYGNQFFFRRLGISKQELNNGSLFEIYPFLKEVIEQENDVPIYYELAMNQFSKSFEINSGRISGANGKVLYFFEIKKASQFDNIEEGILFTYPNRKMPKIPQFIISETTFQDIKKKAKEEILSCHPITVLGEYGTGKRILLNAVANEVDFEGKNIVEIKLKNPNTKTFNRLINKLVKSGKDSIFHIKGMEETTSTQQAKMVSLVNKNNYHVIFSFIGDLTNLEKNTWKFDQEFWRLVKTTPFYLPPLRKRQSELEKVTQAFIIQFNEEYGKQVVGFKPKAIQLLLNHPWYGNFIELYHLIEEIVKRSKEEYMEDEVLSILKEQGLGNYIGEVPGMAFININQTLDEIERSIIRIIMEHENMNQSKVANRLGINRTTLWRKLKED